MYHETKWLIGVSLHSGESLAFWFARLAWAHSVTPSELYRITLQGGRIGGIDLDRHACDDLVETASQRTGIPSSSLQAATLRRWRETVFEVDDGKRPITWVRSISGVYGAAYVNAEGFQMIQKDIEAFAAEEGRRSLMRVIIRRSDRYPQNGAGPLIIP